MATQRLEANAVDLESDMKVALSFESVDSDVPAGPWGRYSARARLPAPLGPGAMVRLELAVPPGSYIYDLAVEVIVGEEVSRIAFPAMISSASSVLSRLPAGADSVRVTYGAQRQVSGLTVKVGVVSATSRAMRRVRAASHSLPGTMTIIARLARQGQAGEIARRAWGRIFPFANLDFPIGVGQYPSGEETRQPTSSVVFTHTLEREGAAISQFELVSALHRCGDIEATVVAPRDGPLRRNYVEKGIRVLIRPCPVANYPTPAQYSHRMADMCAFLTELSPNIIYANTIRNFFAVEAGCKLSIPTLWNLREPSPWHGGLDDMPYYLRARIAPSYKAATQVVFVADATREDWHSICQRDGVSVIPNALACVPAQVVDARERESLRRKMGVDARDVAVLSVGTICARKGQEDMLQALAGLTPKMVATLKVFLIGDADPEYAEQLAALMSRLSPERRERVEFVPATDNVADYYKIADIFLCSSRMESYPRVVLEAMANGLSIVTTPVCGIREQVRNDESALLYAPSDIGSLTDILVQLAADSDERKRLGEGARRALEGLDDFDMMRSAYAHLFRSLA
jgi:glycosyltransferase involved in cell wall biosynthesis